MNVNYLAQNIQIPGKTLIFAYVNLGIESLTINGITITESTILIVSGNSLTWSAVLSTGYELDEESGNIDITGLNKYKFNITPHKVQAPVNVTFYHGIKSITIDDMVYYPSYDDASAIKVIKDQTIDNISLDYAPLTEIIKVDLGNHNYQINCIDGYTASNPTGSLNITNKSGNYSINPSISLIQIPIRITMDSGVSSININGTSYSSSRTINVDYNKDVTWAVVLKTGYQISGSLNSGSFRAINSEGYDINIETTILQVPVRLMFDYGIKSITIDGKDTYYVADLYNYNSKVDINITSRINYINLEYDPIEKIISHDYGNVTWTAEAEDGFELNTSSGSVNATGITVNINPKIKS